MGSVNWEKFKTPNEAKAMFRHCEAEERMKTKHTNADIDKSRTYLNMNFGRFDNENAYEDLCETYDEVLQYLDSQPEANKRKDRVTLLGLSIPAPDGMDDTQAAEWFVEVYRILDDGFKDTLLGGTVHFDEVHEYRDPETKELKMSRPAMHAYVIPIVGDKLNAKAVCSRGNMIALNNQIEAMTAERFPGFKFMDGSKKKSRKTMEELKAESDKAEALVQAEAKAKAKADEILQQAQAEAAKIVESARARADKIEAHAVDKECEAEEDREVARRERIAAMEDREAVNALRSDLKRERENFTHEKSEWLTRANLELTRAMKELHEGYEKSKETMKLSLSGFALATPEKYAAELKRLVQSECEKTRFKNGRTVWDYVRQPFVDALTIASWNTAGRTPQAFMQQADKQVQNISERALPKVADKIGAMQKEDDTQMDL